MSTDAPAPSPLPRISLRQYVVLWLLITAGMTWEYLALNGVTSGPSLLKWLHANGLFLRGAKLTPDPGGALSYRLGWLGFLIIVLTNLYILRKRVGWLQNKGRVPEWLDFHIFCGLMGPTIIVFHTNLKVGGLVAVSFWSMVIVFLSGIVGRYFYLQLLVVRVDHKMQLAFYEDGFKKCQRLTRPETPEKVMRRYKEAALVLAGGTPPVIGGKAGPFTALLESLAGDLRLMVQLPPAPPGFPKSMRRHLAKWAVLRRKVASTGYYQRLMGYWHTFHLPFAIFMYVVTVIHIAASFVFRA